ncbi:orotate phosphoribosyltransferase-like protein [Halorubellus sp. JP-L1]|uniref:transcriptional regulator GfcR n=1 Tax=Halorubellus sp. JP-L1 TaxID=2715753 RepID=UPI0014087B3C|nr:transcriptional regulator GfcR [Halorubellus sp. JP-L1]NHN42604.1 orotate phosphoribosyltransferase-like protein [Halorubellus sp. JP-L1]
MKNVDDLIESAAELADRGLSKGEIADELNVSRETASWLVERSGASAADDDAAGASAPNGPHDIHVDWSAIGRDSWRLSTMSAAMADLLEKEGESVDLTIGIEKAGAPIATSVARELDTDLGTYAPRKHQWEEGDLDEHGGSFSRNFAQIRDRQCYVVDDIITSGTTLTETIEAVKEQGGEPVAACVLVDKQGHDEIDGVPVHSLLQVLRVGNDGA